MLLYVGRVAYEKNIDFLLRMFVRLRARCPDALFVIAGEGPARAHLVSLAQDLDIDSAVRFIGYLDRNTELLDCYAAGNAFVFASRTETQGLVLLEAMAQGTPVVSTAELGTRSILTPDCGAFVVPEDEEQFAAAVAQALALSGEDPRRAKLLAHARTWASQAMARRLIAFYERVRATSQHAAPEKRTGPHRGPVTSGLLTNTHGSLPTTTCLMHVAASLSQDTSTLRVCVVPLGSVREVSRV